MKRCIILIYATFPSRRTAEALSKKLLEARLVASVQLSLIESRFWWKRQIRKRREVLCTIRTLSTLYNRVEERILKDHPYEVPEVFSVEIRSTHPNYVKWITSNVLPKGEKL